MKYLCHGNVLIALGSTSIFTLVTLLISKNLIGPLQHELVPTGKPKKFLQIYIVLSYSLDLGTILGGPGHERGRSKLFQNFEISLP